MSANALDDDAALRLWEQSTELTKVQFIALPDILASKAPRSLRCHRFRNPQSVHGGRLFRRLRRLISPGETRR
jgi:hypothetical protein